MKNVYDYFNPAMVELFAVAKYGSMAKFLAATGREASWWHRSKKKATIKLRDVEQLAESLDCHPCDFMEEGLSGNMLDQERAAYSSASALISDRIQILITTKAAGSQVRFAEAVGIGESQVSNITTKKHAPGFQTLSRIVGAYPDINARWLLTGHGSPTASDREDSTLRDLLESKDEIIRLLKLQLQSKS